MSGMKHRPERYLQVLVRGHFPMLSKIAIPRLRLSNAYLCVQIAAGAMLATITGSDENYNNYNY
jgi:hypothetical protein